MELSWTTFVLEIINFLVLVWILKHFLYKPVLNVLAQRRERVEKTMADAEQLNHEAQALRVQYDGRIADWETERQQARDKLAEELDAERSHKLEQLNARLELEEEKARVAETRRQSDLQRKTEETALLQAAEFATRLLQQAAGPELEQRLVDMVLQSLQQLPEDKQKQIRSGYQNTHGNGHGGAVVVKTAFIPSDEQKQQLSSALRTLLDQEAEVTFEQDDKLIAGVRIAVGAWTLGSNLEDELGGFAELARSE